MAKDPDATDLDAELEASLSDEEFRIIIGLIARHSRWVRPEVYEEVPVVYPRARRMVKGEAANFKGTRRKMDEKTGLMICDNTAASQAFWWARGTRRKKVKNFNVCHIYAGSVGYPEHFTNLANLTAVPKSLESMTEWGPVNAVLKRRSFELYGYTGPDGTTPAAPDLHRLPWRPIRPLKPIPEIIQDLQKQRDRRPTYYAPPSS